MASVDQDWNFTLMNRNAEAVLLRSRESLLGRNMWEEFPGAEDTVIGDRYREAIATGRPVRFEAEYAPHDRWLEISAYPAPRGLTIYFRDVTEKRLLAEQLAQAQRLDSLGQLTGGVAHDFNNLLTVILGGSEVLALDLEDRPHELELAQTISSVARRGAELTRGLLAFARTQPLDPTAVDVNDLLARTSSLLRRTLGREVELVSSPGADVPNCEVDRGSSRTRSSTCASTPGTRCPAVDG